MEVINHRVNPPIKVKSKRTRSLNYWSTNTFVDPEDDVPFMEEELTSEERGHVYFHKLIVGQWIQVYMPYKLMDASTGKLIRGLKSYKTCSPYLNGSLPEKQLKNPRSCLQHFRLSQSDFSTFSRRVESLEGCLVKDEVNVDELLQSIDSLKKEKISIETGLNDFRSKACRVSTDKFYENEEDIANALGVFREARAAILNFNQQVVDVVIKVERLSKEVGRETEKVRVDTLFSELKKSQDELRRLPIDRYEREAIHKFNSDMGEGSVSEVPAHIRNLSQEINELKAYYKCLERLRVVNNSEIAIDLTGVDITITEDTVIVRGDPGALKAYQGDNGIINDENSRRRVRSIRFRKGHTDDA